MDLNKNLQKLGLSEKEACAYLSLLGLGLATMSELVRTSGLKRPTAYLIVEELINKGLVSRLKLNKKLYYKAQPPQFFKAKLQEKNQILEQTLLDLEKIIQNQSGRPQVQILEGREGIKQIYQEIRKHKELIFWSAIEQVAKVLPEELEEELDYQEKHNIKIREIISDTPFGRRYARTQNKKGPRHQTKVLKKTEFANDNLLYGNNLVIFSVREGNLFAVKITSKEIAQTYRIIFEKLWEKY